MKVQMPVVRCPTCQVPWALKVAHTFGADEARTEYLFVRDCKHKASPDIDAARGESALLTVPDQMVAQ